MLNIPLPLPCDSCLPPKLLIHFLLLFSSLGNSDPSLSNPPTLLSLSFHIPPGASLTVTFSYSHAHHCPIFPGLVWTQSICHLLLKYSFHRPTHTNHTWFYTMILHLIFPLFCGGYSGNGVNTHLVSTVTFKATFCSHHVIYWFPCLCSMDRPSPSRPHHVSVGISCQNRQLCSSSVTPLATRFLSLVSNQWVVHRSTLETDSHGQFSRFIINKNYSTSLASAFQYYCPPVHPKLPQPLFHCSCHTFFLPHCY